MEESDGGGEGKLRERWPGEEEGWDHLSVLTCGSHSATSAKTIPKPLRVVLCPVLHNWRCYLSGFVVVGRKLDNHDKYRVQKWTLPMKIIGYVNFEPKFGGEELVIETPVLVLRM